MDAPLVSNTSLSWLFKWLRRYLLVAVAFGLFLVYNGGNITVGDHDNHTVSVNLMQPLYFIIYALVAFFPSIFAAGAHPIAFLYPVMLHKLPTWLPQIQFAEISAHQIDFIFCNHSVSNRFILCNSSLNVCATRWLTFQFIITCRFVHPFILADNRHYTFYIWKNIFRRFYWSKYALIPVYCYGLWALKTVLGMEGGGARK